jgi:diadenosine tetraphosphate (Ap4A) HIT family hydrolase
MEFVDIHNNKIKVVCAGCAINSGEYVPPCGLIYKSDHFAVNQDFEIPISGFMIISCKRHIQSIDQLTDEEQKEFIQIISNIRRGMREELGMEQVALISYEIPGRIDDHFHLWMYPVTKEATDKFGTGIKAIKPMMLYAKENMKTPENIKKVEEAAEKIKEYMNG